MKAVLEFSLPDDEADFKMYLAAPMLSSAVSEVRCFVRGKLKYETLPDATVKILEEIRSMLPAEEE